MASALSLVALLALGQLGAGLGMSRPRGVPSKLDGKVTWTGCTQALLKGTTPRWVRNANELVTCGGTWLSTIPNSPGLDDSGAGAWTSFAQSAGKTEALNSTDAWTAAGVGAAAPTVTADQNTTPWGTATAERVQFAAAPLDQNASTLSSASFVATSGARTASIWAKGNGASQNFWLGIALGDRSTCTQTQCIALAGSWTRCSHYASLASQNWYVVMGNDRRCTGRSDLGAADVFLAGANFSNTAYLAPYAPNANASAASQASSYGNQNSTATSLAQPMCWGVKAQPADSWAAGYARFLIGIGAGSGNNRGSLQVNATNQPVLTITDNSGNAKTWTGTALTGAAAKSFVACIDQTGGGTLHVDGVQASATASGTTGTLGALPATITVGAHAAGSSQFCGWFSSFCQGRKASDVIRCAQ